MFLLEKLEYSNFSNSEQIVVDYLLTQREAIEELTISQIAANTFSSKSSLVRISKKLGFKGWTDFKKAFLEEINYFNKQNSAIDANIPFDKSDNYLQIASKIANLEKEAIEDTLSLLKAKTINEAIHLMKEANTIHIFAASNNLLNAQEFAHNMSRIQKDVRIHQLQGEVLFNAYLAQENSLALIISYSGGTESLIRIAKILKEKNIPIISITSLGDNPISLLADINFRLATKEKLYSKIGTFSTDASITYLLDTIYSCIFAQEYEKNLKLRQLASRIIESERHADSTILRELDTSNKSNSKF